MSTEVATNAVIDSWLSKNPTEDASFAVIPGTYSSYIERKHFVLRIRKGFWICCKYFTWALFLYHVVNNKYRSIKLFLNLGLILSVKLK